MCDKMKKYLIFTVASLLLMPSCLTKKEKPGELTRTSGEVKLVTLDPGHFHAALVQKNSYKQVADEVYVYAPEGDDVQEHLNKINGYNTRTDSPTKWKEVVYLGSDFLEKMLSEKKGNVMITAGNNGKKTEYIKQTLMAGIHVLADKPMAINSENFDIARGKGILLYDIMTERHEITTVLQRELSCIPAVYGEQLKGTPEEPAIVKESVHHFFKVVSGTPLKRPAWFFDVNQQGEGIVDVTTHLVDLVQWEAFPEQVIDYTQDIELLDANRWTTSISPFLRHERQQGRLGHPPGQGTELSAGTVCRSSERSGSGRLRKGPYRFYGKSLSRISWCGLEQGRRRRMASRNPLKIPCRP